MTIAGYVPAIGETDLSKITRSIRNLYENGASRQSVVIEDFGGGTDKTDNTSALLAAVASVSGPVEVVFANVGDYTFTQPNATTFTKDGVYLRGQGRSTGLKYAPTGDGTFLKWQAPVAFAPMVGGGLTNISIYSPDLTRTKVAVEENGVSEFIMNNVAIGRGYNNPTYQAWSGGAGSTGYYPKGWDFNLLDRVWIAADKPVEIGMNPYWSYNDHWTWTRVILASTPSVGNFNDIAVDPGVAFSNCTFQGFSWNGGVFGFQYQDTGGVNSVYAIDTAGTGYSVGDVLNLSGGTWATFTPTALVLSVNGSGGITAASIKSPGFGLSAMPAGNLFTCSGGTGTGAKLNAYYVNTFALKFADGRIEQGSTVTGPSVWSFYLQSGGLGTQMTGVTFENVYLDGFRNGIFLDGVNGARINGCTHTGNTSYGTTVVNATSASDNISLKGNSWLFNGLAPLNGTFTGLTAIEYTPNPSTTNATILQNATYSKTSSYVVPTLKSLSATLASDIALNSTSYTDVLSVTTGSGGVWLVAGSIAVTDSTATPDVLVRVKGTTTVATPPHSVPVAGKVISIPVCTVISNPTSTITVSMKTTVGTTASAKWSRSGDGLDSKITVTRIG